MEDVKKETAQTNAATAAQGGSHADTAPTEEEVNEATFTDGAPEDASYSPPAQTKEQNAAFARRRREAERQAAIKAAASKAREDAIIETLGGKNPYTGHEMKDSVDVEEYLTMREIEKEGGDPLSDFSTHHKQKERERAQAAQTKREQDAWFEKDSKDFAQKYPDVDVGALVQNADFAAFAEGKVGVKPLSEIYEGFIGIVGHYEEKAKDTAKRMIANRNASPGALAGNSIPEAGHFTKEQVEKMSAEEVRRHFSAIRESMKTWK